MRAARPRPGHPYVPPGPVVAAQRGLTAPLLRACREYLETESNWHFGLRPTAGRSLSGRLASR
ncbi:hypothetical protein [Streptomyces cacaoi]|uniref:hypothetical protein n=1 Tax=Streptomyces cacaoi TaxID=1898 RepID=UPI003749EA89